MLFPSSDRLIFEHNPLQSVVCQLRFPSILEIGTADPASFQNRIRSVYFEYHRDDGIPLGLPVGVPEELSRLISQLPKGFGPGLGRPTHRFVNPDTATRVSLTTDFVAIETSKYTRWEPFREEIVRMEQAFEAEYNPALYTRIGLRYLNVIDRNALGITESWDTLINPVLLGLLGVEGLKGRVKENQTETLLQVPDIPDAQLLLKNGLVRLQPDNREAYLVDADFFVLEKRRDRDGILRDLDTFRETAGNLFRWVATDKLRRILNPMEDDS